MPMSDFPVHFKADLIFFLREPFKSSIFPACANHVQLQY